MNIPNDIDPIFIRQAREFVATNLELDRRIEAIAQAITVNPPFTRRLPDHGPAVMPSSLMNQLHLEGCEHQLSLAMDTPVESRWMDGVHVSKNTIRVQIPKEEFDYPIVRIVAVRDDVPVATDLRFVHETEGTMRCEHTVTLMFNGKPPQTGNIRFYAIPARHEFLSMFRVEEIQKIHDGLRIQETVERQRIQDMINALNELE